MKVVFINLGNENKEFKIRQLKLINDCNTYMEVIIPVELLNKRIFDWENKFSKKLKLWLFDKKLKKILNAKEKKIAVLSRRLSQCKEQSAMRNIKEYLENILEDLNFVIHDYTGNIKNNVDEYLKEELKKLKVKAEEAKLLLLYNNPRNIDFNLLENMIKRYKNIDIFCSNKELAEVDIKQKIEALNEKYGTSISYKNKIQKQEMKNRAYHVCIYMEKSDYKINNCSKIQLWDNDCDKFDSYVLKTKETGILKAINNDYFMYITKNYGRLKVMSLLYKTTLDK